MNSYTIYIMSIDPSVAKSYAAAVYVDNGAPSEYSVESSSVSSKESITSDPNKVVLSDIRNTIIDSIKTYNNTYANFKHLHRLSKGPREPKVGIIDIIEIDEHGNKHHKRIKKLRRAHSLPPHALLYYQLAVAFGRGEKLTYNELERYYALREAYGNINGI